MQRDHPQTFKYLSQLNLFAVYCQDYMWCHQLLESFSKGLHECHNKLLLLTQGSQTSIEGIRSKVVRNIADLHLRKVCQATDAIGQLSATFQQVFEQVSDRSQAMQQLRTTNEEYVEARRGKCEWRNQCLQRKSKQLEELASQYESQLRNYNVDRLVSEQYREKKHSQPDVPFCDQAAIWRIHHLQQEIQHIRSQVTLEQQDFEVQSQKSYRSLADMSRKLFSLMDRQAFNQLTFRAKDEQHRSSMEPVQQRQGSDDHKDRSIVPPTEDVDSYSYEQESRYSLSKASSQKHSAHNLKRYSSNGGLHRLPLSRMEAR